MITIAKPIIGKEEKSAVLEVLGSGKIAQGKKVAEFEKRFAKYIGSKHAIATSSGTAALHLALLAYGIKNGDEVITTPFSFISTSDACLFVGAKPVFADINPDTFNIDPEEIEKKISPNTKALIVVHLYGNPCNMDEITKIVQRHNLILIEDSAQAHGAEFNGKKTGTFGIGCFSFFATKNMTTGEGGMVTTNDDKIAQKVRLLRQHGAKIPYHHNILGFNYCMSDIEAAIGVEQLKKLDSFNEIRIRNAKFLTEALKGIGGITTPKVQKKSKHVFHQFTIRVSDKYPVLRDSLLMKLRRGGVEAKVYYPMPIYRQKSYRKLVGIREPQKLHNVEEVVREVLSLPIHPGVKMKDLESISKVIRNFVTDSQP